MSKSKKQGMKTTQTTLSISEQIDRARDGRSQRSIVEKMNLSGLQISETIFSNKKKYGGFTEDELAKLSEILGTEIKLS